MGCLLGLRGFWMDKEGQTAVCPYGVCDVVYGFLVDGVGITARLAGS